jgi:hypothetical protein
MDTHLDRIDCAQEEFHQVFDVRMEDVQEDVQVLKNDVDVVKIEMLSVHKDIRDVEMSVNNTQLRMERIEDHLDILPKMSHRIEMYGSQS